MKTEDTLTAKSGLHPQTQIGNLYSTITSNEIFRVNSPLAADGDDSDEDCPQSHP